MENNLRFEIPNCYAADKNWNFVNTSEEILAVLVNSRENGSSVGICCPVLGSDVLITAVENIILEDGQTIIALKHYDQSGYILPLARINLLEIKAVCPFTSVFKNPFLDNLEKDKSWFF